MAGILDAMAPYVTKLIADMATEEVDTLLGVSGEIKKLEDNMGSIKCFLADAERRRITDQVVQRWVRKLKDAMYDATDILDLCQLEAERRKESKLCGSTAKKASGCLQPLLFCLQNPLFAHKIGSRIKELNQRLQSIHKEADQYKFNISLGSSPEPRKFTAAELSSYRTGSQIDESAIVGEQIERDTRELVQVLTTDADNNRSIKVVSIIGAGGMGKTTLAQKIFNDATIQGHFKTKIWLSITQQFDEAELLRTAIKHAGGNHGREQDKSTLTDILINTLSTKGRFLIVMDDVWSQKAWNDVLSVPVRNASKKLPGSRVLVTTRSAHLPQQMQAPLHQHHVKPLENEDAWSLLKKQLQPDQVDGNGHLKDVGMKIIKKCGGLPLAVKVMGGLLSTRSRTEGEWQAVLNHPAWSMSGLPKELDNRIYLSYEDLSAQLKQCFLYCSLSSKGTFIRMSEVISLWISEGFVKPQGGNSSYDDRLEEIANEYYYELIMRNLIEPTEGSKIDRYECTMHDVVRSFAEFMAREDSLMVQDQHVAGGREGSLVHLMSVGPTKLVPEWTNLPKQEMLTTLIINSEIKFKTGDSFTRFSRLRVLSINGGECDMLVDSLCQLRHLRYLCLDNTNISRLPDNIHTMKFLLHIVIGGSSRLETLPRTIMKLVQLRTLDMYDSNVDVIIPKGFGGLTNLRTLFGFPVHMDMDGDGDWCSLEEIGHLSQIRRLTLHNLENVAASSFAEMATISSKEKLEYLELCWSSSRCMEVRDGIEKQRLQQTAEEVIEKLQPPSSIQHLHIEEYFGRRLPNWMVVPATLVFKSLRILKLENLPCCTELPNGLCRLPSLQALVIENAPAIRCIGSTFQECSSMGVAFPNLTSLHLEGLSAWKEWEWQGQGEDESAKAMAMPALRILTLDNCKLSCLPPGLSSSKRLGLRDLFLYELSNLQSVDNFLSVVELDVFDCPMLTRISGLSTLQKLRIFGCPNVEVLEGVPLLDSMEIKDYTMETLPEYLTMVTPRYLKLTCSKKLYESLLTATSSENSKISHIKSRTIDYIVEDED